MTKVVFQGRDYLLRDEFWQECQESGFVPKLVEWHNGARTVRPITRAEFEARFSGRVASWVTSEDKTVSVFRDALSPENLAHLNRLYEAAVLAGLDAVANEFTARTGAQGKIRLPADVSFVLIIHTRAKDGSPQLHGHIPMEDRVRVRGHDKTVAAHKRDLYRLRKLFTAAKSQDLGHTLIREFGVSVLKSPHGITIPDVPNSLCRMTSVRSSQIDDYLKKHNIKNTPLSRRYASVVTRRENKDPSIGREAFREELKRSGFRSEQISNRVTLDQFVDVNAPSLLRETKRVGREAKRLAKEQPAFSRHELLTRALETAEPRHTAYRVERATDCVLLDPSRYGLQKQTDRFGKTVYASPLAHRQWRKVMRKIEYVFRAEQNSKTNRASGPHQSQRSQSTDRNKNADGANNSTRSSAHKKQRDKSDTQREKSTNFNRVVEKALRSYRVIGAVGHAGIKAAEKAVELYQVWAKPIWRVHGDGHKTTPGSVAKMVRDLKPLTVMESHKAAILAMLKLNGSLDQKLRYGEYVYRQSRKAKFRVPRNALIVIRDVGQAHPKDVTFLLRKAERAKAKTIFVDRDVPRSLLVQAAKSMKPGEAKHYAAPEMSR
ncbi:MAG: relaxase domain-containing protein [Gemmataceae bacterium]